MNTMEKMLKVENKIEMVRPELRKLVTMLDNADIRKHISEENIDILKQAVSVLWDVEVEVNEYV